ncbi:MAG: GAF domain-containing protein [candidate division KSB1 bacterium]
MYVPNGKISTSSSLMALAGLNRLFEAQENLDGLLQNAARIIVDSLALQRCVITWLAEDRVTMSVRAKYSRTNLSSLPTQTASQPNLIAADYNPGLVPVVFEASAESSNGMQTPQKFTAPLRVNQQVIGYVCVARGKTSYARPQLDAEFFQAVCELLGRAVEFMQMRQMLNSRYALAAASKAARAETGNAQTLDACVLQSVQNPERIARIIARSFYKDLRKAGFAAKQILLIASEIIGHLSEVFHKTKAKAK